MLIGVDINQDYLMVLQHKVHKQRAHIMVAVPQSVHHQALIHQPPVLGINASIETIGEYDSKTGGYISS